MSILVSQPLLHYNDANGKPLPGALCNVYYSGTSTRAPVWKDSANTIPHENPFEALTNGYFPAFYVDAGAAVKLIITDANGGNPLPPIDPANTTSLSQSEVGFALNPQTDTEDAADLTPINYAKWATPIKDISRHVSDNTGAVDVSAQFTAAFKAERRIIIPEGTYLLNSEVTVFQPPVPHYGITVEGANRNNTILKLRGAPTNSTALRFATFGQDIHLSNFCIDLQTTAGFGYRALRFAEARDSTIDFLRLVGSTATGADDSTLILLDGTGTFTGELIISNSIFNNALIGVDLNGSCTTVKMINNAFVVGGGFTNNSVGVYARGSFGTHVLALNTFQGWDRGSYVTGGQQVRQLGNYFEGNQTWDFHWTAASSSNVSIADTNPGTPKASFPYDNAHANVVFGGSYGAYFDSQAIGAWRGFTELGLTVPMGYRTAYTPTLAAGAGTLGSTTISYAYYRRIGGSMQVWFSISGTLSGSATPVLTISIPGSLFPAASAQNPCSITNGGSTIHGLAFVNTSGSVINISIAASGSGNWTNGAVAAAGQIEFPILS